MSACETCWGDAYARARMLGGTQVEHYYVLLEERAADHADPARMTTRPTRDRPTPREATHTPEGEQA